MTLEDPILDALDHHVLTVLKDTGPQTRPALCALTHIAWTTMHNRLTKLILNRCITKYAHHTGKPGRPKVYFKLMRHN